MRYLYRVMFLASSLLHLVNCILTQFSTSCHGDLDDECGEHETCKQDAKGDGTFGFCECMSGFQRENGVCILNKPPIPSSSTSTPILGSVATALLWTLGILIVLAATMVVLIRRYALLDRLYALRVRRYDTVFVSTAANVDDDAPIT